MLPCSPAYLEHLCPAAAPAHPVSTPLPHWLALTETVSNWAAHKATRKMRNRQTGRQAGTQLRHMQGKQKRKNGKEAQQRRSYWYAKGAREREWVAWVSHWVSGDPRQLWPYKAIAVTHKFVSFPSSSPSQLVALPTFCIYFRHCHIFCSLSLAKWAGGDGAMEEDGVVSCYNNILPCHS